MLDGRIRPRFRPASGVEDDGTQAHRAGWSTPGLAGRDWMVLVAAVGNAVRLGGVRSSGQPRVGQGAPSAPALLDWACPRGTGFSRLAPLRAGAEKRNSPSHAPAGAACCVTGAGPIRTLASTRSYAGPLAALQTLLPNCCARGGETVYAAVGRSTGRWWCVCSEAK